MSLLPVVVLLSLLALSYAGQAPPCDDTQYIRLKRNQNWNWPDPGLIPEGFAICYEFTFSDDTTYGSVNIHMEDMNEDDKFWVVDNFNNEYYYTGPEPYNSKIMAPPNTVTVGLYKRFQSSMKVKQFQIITVLFDPSKKPTEICIPTTPCIFNYGLLKQGDTYRFDAVGAHKLHIYSATPTTWILAYDSTMEYLGALRDGIHDPENDLILYVSWSGASGSITVVSDDYAIPTTPPLKTIPPTPSTQPTLPPTPPTQQTIPPVTFPPIITNPPAPTTKSSNNGQSTTNHYVPTTPKMGSQLFGYLPMITGLLFILVENCR